MGYFEELKARPKDSAANSAKLDKMSLSTPEKGVLLGWGMEVPFVAETIQEDGDRVLYIWRGQFSPHNEAPVLMAPARPGEGLSRDSDWNFGVIRQDEVPTDNPIEAFAAAAHYPAIGEKSKIAIAIAQLAIWIPPNYGGPLAQAP